MELDENGKLIPFTAEQCVAVFARWASTYPAARFVVISLIEDGSDAHDLGWGLAFPDYAFAYLPNIHFAGRFRVAQDVIDFLRPSMDARLIWVDPEPEQWPDDDD
jgi:hypothetical protein